MIECKLNWYRCYRCICRYYVDKIIPSFMQIKPIPLPSYNPWRATANYVSSSISILFGPDRKMELRRKKYSVSKNYGGEDLAKWKTLRRTDRKGFLGDLTTADLVCSYRITTMCFHNRAYDSVFLGSTGILFFYQIIPLSINFFGVSLSFVSFETI